jgi:hypothetical protein
MVKIEEKLGNITEDDIVTIGSIAGVISAKINKIMVTYSDPKIYSQKILSHLKHNHHIVATFISFNLIHMDSQTWSSPDDFKTIVKKISENENNTVDTTSMLSSSIKKATKEGDVYLDSKVINKALELLKKEFRVVHIKSKKEMEGITGQKIKELEGRPSFYNFNLMNLDKIISNPTEVRLIINILKNFGLVHFLALTLEAEYHVLKKNKDKVYEIAWAYMKSNEKQIKVPEREEFKSAVNNTISLYDGLDENKLKIVIERMANLMTEHRFFHPYILSIALSKNL